MTRTLIGTLVSAAVLSHVGAALTTEAGVPQFYTGNALYAACNELPSHPSTTQATICIGYVAAIADLSMFGSPILGSRACLPLTGVTLEEIAESVRRYLQAHPEERAAAGILVVAHALSKAFPCPGQ